MSAIELLVFLLLCAGIGFVGHLFSARYGWLAGVVVAAPVFIVALIAQYRQLYREIRYGVKVRRRRQ